MNNAACLGKSSAAVLADANGKNPAGAVHRTARRAIQVNW